ncbi:ABC transporter substrate-binding protein [Naumannella huperziae]
MRLRPALLAGVLILAPLAGCASAGTGPTAMNTPMPSGGMDMGGGKGGDGKGGDGGMDMGGAPQCPPPAADGPAPERIVTMDSGAAAFLVELGQADRIVGTAAPDFTEAFDGELRRELDRIKVIDPGRGNRERVLAAEPDLVTGISLYEFGAFDGTPTLDQLAENGARVVVACDTAAGRASTGIDDTYRYVDELGRVLGVPDEAAALNDRLRGELPRIDPGAEPVRILGLSAAPTGGQGVKTQGASSLANGIYTLAGGENIAGSVNADFADLSAEEVATRDPQLIVAVTGLGPESPEDLVAAIKASPLLANTTAVREDRIVAVPQSILLSPSVLNPRAAKLINEAATR